MVWQKREVNLRALFINLIYIFFPNARYIIWLAQIKGTVMRKIPGNDRLLTMTTARSNKKMLAQHDQRINVMMYYYHVQLGIKDGKFSHGFPIIVRLALFSVGW